MTGKVGCSSRHLVCENNSPCYDVDHRNHIDWKRYGSHHGLGTQRNLVSRGSQVKLSTKRSR